MALLEPTPSFVPRVTPAHAREAACSEREARRDVGAQVARLERDLSDVLVSCFPFADADAAVVRAPSAGGPRVLGMGELEALRDCLAARLSAARLQLEALGREQERHRARLERMLLEPGKHRFETISNKQLGQGGCGVWQVRPRLGLIGMLAGWWHVKLSSGCPLATARR